MVHAPAPCRSTYPARRSSFHIGPLDIRFYALGYIFGITLAIHFNKELFGARTTLPWGLGA